MNLGNRQNRPPAGIGLEIHKLQARLGTMFDLADDQLTNAVNALVAADQELAEETRLGDRRIDALALANDRHCVEVLNSHQPREAALHMIIAGMRISRNLERIGDQCKNTCKAVPEVQMAAGWQSSTNILDIADAARRILHAARDAYAQKDRLKARQVLANDRQVDRAYQEVFATLASLGFTNQARTRAILHLVTVSKSLERIADHAKSIARSVVYFTEGIDVRYNSLSAHERAVIV